MGEMRVIGAGLGRTGTVSLLNGLEILGYTSTHFMTFANYPELAEDVTRVLETIDFKSPLDPDVLDQFGPESNYTKAVDKLIEDTINLGFDATQDGPWSELTYEFYKRFPDAKVILSTRDSRKWAESVLTMRKLAPPLHYFPWNQFYMFTVGEKIQAFFLQPHCPTVPLERKKGGPGSFFVPAYEACEKIPYNEKIENLIRHKDAHEKRIRELIPAESLLEWTVTDGWEPLCRFLEIEKQGKSCPSDLGEEFPRMNDSQNMLKLRFFFWSVVYFWPIMLAAALYFLFTKILILPFAKSKLD